MPIIACSLILNGPGFKEKENLPNGTVYSGRILARSRPRGWEARITKNTGNAAVVCPRKISTC